jgi:hypothetical protein
MLFQKGDRPFGIVAYCLPYEPPERVCLHSPCGRIAGVPYGESLLMSRASRA